MQFLIEGREIKLQLSQGIKHNKHNGRTGGTKWITTPSKCAKCGKQQNESKQELLSTLSKRSLHLHLPRKAYPASTLLRDRRLQLLLYGCLQINFLKLENCTVLCRVYSVPQLFFKLMHDTKEQHRNYFLNLWNKNWCLNYAELSNIGRNSLMEKEAQYLCVLKACFTLVHCRGCTGV